MYWTLAIFPLVVFQTCSMGFLSGAYGGKLIRCILFSNCPLARAFLISLPLWNLALSQMIQIFFFGYFFTNCSRAFNISSWFCQLNSYRWQLKFFWLKKPIYDWAILSLYIFTIVRSPRLSHARLVKASSSIRTSSEANTSYFLSIKNGLIYACISAILWAIRVSSRCRSKVSGYLKLKLLKVKRKWYDWIDS